MGGGEHAHGEGAHGGGDFRAKVWSMSGGPYCRPKHWKRNTAIAMFGVFLVCIPIAMKSAELEVCSSSSLTRFVLDFCGFMFRNVGKFGSWVCRVRPRR